MGTGLIVPHDIVAEESLIGAMLLSQDAVVVGIENCRAEDFYSPFNASVFSAIEQTYAQGRPADMILIASMVKMPESVERLMSMQINCPSPGNARTYASIVSEASVARKLMFKFEESKNMLREGGNPFEISASVSKFVDGIGSVVSSEPQAVTIEELAMRAEEMAPVVIPGMMNRDYRTIVVAEEGAGKSMLLRTIAMSSAQGFHPFSHARIEPVRALIVDLENPAAAITQTGLPFSEQLRRRDPGGYDGERLKIYRRPGGMEIRRLSDRAELQREIASHRPELVCIGPIYKMYRRKANESYEDSADEAMAVLDELRTKYEFALIMEHHAAKGRPGEKRDLSPMGSQRWMAWPEVGISLYKDSYDPTVMHVKRYRGDRLQGVDWPDKLIRDNVWMFDGVWDRI